MNKNQLNILSESSLLTDFKDLIKTGSEIFKKSPGSKNEIKSITSAVTNDLVAQFPVIVTNGISIDNASIISNSVEKDMAVTMMLLVSANKIVNADDYDGPVDWLKRFNVNLGFEWGEDSRVFQKTSRELLSENLVMFPKYKPMYKTDALDILSESNILDNVSLAKAVALSREGKLDINMVASSSFSAEEQMLLMRGVINPAKAPLGIEVEDMTNRINAQKAQDAIDDAKQETEAVTKDMASLVNEAMNGTISKDEFSKSIDRLQNSVTSDIGKAMFESTKKIIDNTKANEQINYDLIKKGIATTNKSAELLERYHKDVLKQAIRQKTFDDRSLGRAVLKPTEVKKANELTPTIVNVSLQFVSESQNFGYNFDFGVKSVMHVVTSEALTSEIIKGISKGGSIFKFMRWTTGEIKFFKDLVFDIDNIKMDAIQELSKSSDHILAFVKKRKRAKKFKRIVSLFTNSHDILPNATFVVSEEEVTFIKDVSKVDLMNPHVITSFMNEYFLLQFIIINEFDGLIYIFKDGDLNYQTFTIDELREKSAGNNNQLMRAMSSMVNKSL